MIAGADSFIDICSLKSNRREKLCPAYLVSVWGNLWGLKLNTAEQQA